MLTEFGLVFIPIALAILFFSIWIGIKWINVLVNKDKKTTEKEKIGCMGSLFTISLFFSIFSIAVSMSIFLPSLVYKTFFTPSFEATVTHHTSSWQESDSTDAYGNKIRTKTMMYLPYVSFQNPQGLTINNIPLSIHSSAPLEIGKIVTVGYTENDQTAYEKSFRSGLLYAAATLMLFILWFLSIWIIAYSFKVQTDKYLAFAQFLIFRIVLPIGITSMFCMLVYVLFEYYFLGDPKKRPIWAVAICILFSISLLPVLYSLIKPKQDNH